MSHVPHRRLNAALLALLLAGAVTLLALADDGAPSPGLAGKQDHHHGRGKGHDDDQSPATTPAPPLAPSTATPAAPVVPPPASAAPALAPAPEPAAPELGRTVGLAPVSGTVLVRAPGGVAAPLTGDPAALPTGTRIDARNGAVDLTSALDAAGTTQTGRFAGGVFEVRQAKGAMGLTQIVMIGGSWDHCPATKAHASAPAHAAAKKRRKPVRSLWGSDDHGRFQTRGRGSVATVRGTRWLTEDFCDGTRTTVTAGAVAVRSRRTGKTVVVRAGHRRFTAR